MANELKDLVKEIKYKTGKTIEVIAEEVGYSRAYLNNEVSKGTNKRLLETLRNHFNAVIEQSVRNDGSVRASKLSGVPGISSSPGIPEGIQVPLEMYLDKLEKHNALLERLLESNLSALATTQQVILAEVKAGLKWEARKLAKGDQRKEAEILAEVSTLVGEYLMTYVSKDSNVPVSS